MNILLQVTTNLYSSVQSKAENSFWWDFSKDFIVPIGIAILAALTAYYIFISETKRDRRNEDRKKAEERNHKLLFFATLVESCLTVSVQQKNYIKDFIRKIKNDDVDFHLLTFLPLNDLKRVSNVLNLELYMLAFVDKYPSSRKGSIKIFKEIITSIDYLLEIFNQIPKQLEKAQMYDYERKVKMQGLFQSAYNLAGRISMHFEGNDNETSSTLMDLYYNFVNRHPGDYYNINYYYEYFFVPYNDFCSNYIASGKAPLQEIIDLALLTRDAKQLYNQIKSANNVLRADLTIDFKNINRTLIDLRTSARQLLSEI